MKKIFPLLACMLAFWGCAGSYKPVDVSGLVWPRQPEKTRVRMISYIMSDLDVRALSSVETMFGEDATFGFAKPHGIAADGEGNIYVTDSILKLVSVINRQTGYIGILMNPYGWSTPLGVAVDDKNRLVAVTDAGRGAVYVFEKDGLRLKTIIGQNGEFRSPAGVAFDPDRQIIYVSDIKKHEVSSFTLDGKFISTIATGGDAVGTVYFPDMITTDEEGRLYVVDTMNFRFQIFDPKGEPAKAFGEHGDKPGMFARPKGIAVTKDGYILITDAAFGNFQIFDKNGYQYLAVGSPGRGFGAFNIPQGIAVDKNDVIYVVDQINRRIQIFQLYTDEYYKNKEASEVKPIEDKKETK